MMCLSHALTIKSAWLLSQRELFQPSVVKFLPDDTLSPNITLQRLQMTLVFAFGSCRREKCHLNVIQLFLKGIYNFNIVPRV